MVDANERITDVSFEGKGCAISVASASLMTEMLKGRSDRGSREPDGRLSRIW